jgi:two-component system KDP operon response regulator KdpE
VTEARTRVLVVDDEPAIRRFLNASLAAHDYAVFEADTGDSALGAVALLRPDLIILDLGLPDIDGIDVTRMLREWTRVPIIVLSVRGQESDKIEALDAGADDYVTKPFGVGELLARMRAALRRTAPGAAEPVLAVGQISVDQARHSVTVQGRPVQLTPTEYDLLLVLALNAGKLLTHRQLLREVWGAGAELDLHLLRVNIFNLRHKLEPEPSRPRYIVTEPGVGYRLQDRD